MHATVAKVSDFLKPEQVRRLRGKSDFIGTLLVLHAWATIAGSMALVVWWPNPATFLVAVMVIGGRQLGLAILMHDAAHGLLFARRDLNDRVGSWLCAWPVFTSLTLYRPYHLQHHRFTQQPADPDLGLSAAFPVSRRSLRRKIIRDLTGQTAFLRRGGQLRRAFGPANLGVVARLENLWRREGGGAIAANLVLLGVLTLAGYWWLYPTLWLLPLATWYQLASRVRNIAEHAVVPDNDDPLRNTRTTHAGPLARLLLAPYWVNYHLEHHLFMFVPCWRLPAAHRILREAADNRAMELKSGYLLVLRAATAVTAESPRSSSGHDKVQHI